MKKIFISADIEGAAGVTNWCETRYGGQGYEAACRQMTLETAAACRAAVDAGYEVVVKDGHEDAMNIDAGMLPRGVRLIRGWASNPMAMMSGLDESFAGAIYIGYHSAAGTNTSPLKHTIEDYLFNWIKVNGVLMSEFGLNSLLADELKVPSLFLSGDKGICEEAEKIYPGIVTVATKEGVGNSTCSLHPEDAVEQIEAGVARSLSGAISVRPLEEKYTMEINFKDHQRARNASWYPGAESVDPFTVRYTAAGPFELAVARTFMCGV